MTERSKKSVTIGQSGLPNVDNFDYEHTSTRQTETSHVAPASTRAVPARPTLMIVRGADEGRVVRMDRDGIVIGRATDCQMILPDPGVSRRHCRLFWVGEQIVLEDLGSKNGTFVDGAPANGHELSYGATFHVGPNVTVRLALMTAAEERVTKELYDGSMRDPLTRTYNRRYLMQRITAELAFAARHRVPVSIIMLDVDHFKKLNDTYGHAAGDAALQHLTRVVLGALRSEDVMARIGGEEFAVVLRNIAHADALACAERIRRAVADKPFALGNEAVTVTVSLGVATNDAGTAPGCDELLGLADERLYVAKGNGRNRVVGA